VYKAAVENEEQASTSLSGNGSYVKEMTNTFLNYFFEELESVMNTGEDSAASESETDVTFNATIISG
jgi:hypothetical protein